MVIGVHAVAAFRPKPTGVEQYTQALLRAMLRLPELLPHRLVLYLNRSPNPDALRALSLPLGRNATIRALRSPALWTQFRLSSEMFLRPPDTLFVPAQALPRILPRRTVVTIHGIEFEHVPHCYPRWQRRYLRFVTRDAVRRATHIIAVSEATKRDLVERYGVSESRIRVIAHGAPVPLLASGGEDVEGAPRSFRRADRGRGGKPYFLSLGRIELKKNIDGIVRAFTLLWQRGFRDTDFLLAGLPGFGFPAIREVIDRSPAREAISLLGYIEEEEKWAILRGALALLFPSAAEGFGIPILEAQAAGVPVIASDLSAIAEVAGDGALLVPFGDDGALADAMERLANDSALRDRLVAAGRLNVQRFSWERSARATLSLLLEG